MQHSAISDGDFAESAICQDLSFDRSLVRSLPHCSLVSSSLTHSLAHSLVHSFLHFASSLSSPSAFSLVLTRSVLVSLTLAPVRLTGQRHRHRTAPHRTAPHRTAPHRTAPHRTAPSQAAPSRAEPRRAEPRRALSRCFRPRERESTDERQGANGWPMNGGDRAQTFLSNWWYRSQKRSLDTGHSHRLRTDRKRRFRSGPRDRSMSRSISRILPAPDPFTSHPKRISRVSSA